GEERKHLPGWHVHANSRRDPPCGPERSDQMSAPRDSMISVPSDAPSDRPLLLVNVSRRTFLAGVGALGGLVLAVGFPAALRAADPPKYGRDGMPDGWVADPRAVAAIGRGGRGAHA